MRIIGGIHRSRKLETPKDNVVRPTSDKVRESVFNMLNSRGLLIDSCVIDAFCGTGGLGLEALSQGAAFCTFIDKSKTSFQLCKRNIASLKEEQRSRVIMADVTKTKENSDLSKRADLVFMDPPYGQSLIAQSVQALLDQKWLNKKCYFVIEEKKNEVINSDLLETHNQKIYGDTQIILASLKS